LLSIDKKSSSDTKFDPMIDDSVENSNLSNTQNFDYLTNIFEQSVENNNLIQANLFNQLSENSLYKDVYTDFEKLRRETKEIFSLKFD
jgi:hypothetical protein